MLLWQKGVIIRIIKDSLTKQIVEIMNESDDLRLGINYPILSGICRRGDEILYNTTAVELALGTGGFDFVIANLTNPPLNRRLTSGHIIKNRYTPLQFAIQSGEELEDHHNDWIKIKPTLDQVPVLIIGLHSMLPLLTLFLKHSKPHCTIIYVMTDSSSLPIWLSEHVAQLSEQQLLTSTVTAGQTFGGEVEAVNKFSALFLAKERLKADYIIIGPGPGSVGTGSELGFSAIEVGELVNAVAVLSGNPIVVPRISFSDWRTRHVGISHHSLTALSKVTLSSAYFPLPILEEEKNKILLNQVEGWMLERKHHIEWMIPESAMAIAQKLARYPLNITTMGRGIEQDPAFFQGVSVAANYALTL